MNTIFKAFFLSLSILASEMFARVYFTPPVYMTGAYAKVESDLGYPRSFYARTPSFFTHFTGLITEFNTCMTLYSRSATQAYDACSGSKRDFSYLFHGSDSFSLAELFPSNVLPLTPLSSSFSNIKITPHYRYSEKGCIFGLDIGRECEFGGKTYTLQLQMRLPLKEVLVNNPDGAQGSVSVVTLNSTVSPTPVSSSSSVPSGAFKIQNEVGTNGAYEAFAARINFLKDQGLLQVVSRQPQQYYVVNGGFNATSADAATAGTPDISFASLAGGKALDRPTGTRIYEQVTAVSSGTQFTTTSGTFTHTLPVTGVDANTKGALPLGLYSKVSSSQKDAVGAGVNFVVYPIVSTTSDATQDVYVYDAHSGSVLSSSDKIANGSEFNILAAPTNTLGISLGVNFKVPPLIVQKPYSNSFPQVFGKTATLATDQEASLTSYASVYNPGSSSIGFVSSTGSDFINADGSPNTTADKGVFWYGIDYANLGGENYVTTSLDTTSRPTPESQALLAELKRLQVTEATPSVNQKSVFVSANFVKGDFVNGMDSSGTPLSPLNPSMQWNLFSKKGIGDLDLALSLAGSWLDDSLAASFILGAAVPTADVVSPVENYLATPLGNNGHFEIKAGAQAAYDISSWMRFIGCGIYSWALKAPETIVSPFKGANVFGLQPSFVSASISWQQMLATLDVTLFPNEKCGIDLGYQYMLKRHDSISLLLAEATDGLGTKNQPLSAERMQGLSKRQAHKFKAVFFAHIAPECTISLGWDGVLAGRNIGKESDLYLSLAMQF